MTGFRISRFRCLGKDGPDDGNGDFFADDGDDEKVDVMTPELPISAIHGEDVTLLRARQAAQNNAGNGVLAEVKLEKEILKTPISAFVRAPFAIGDGGESDQVGGTTPDDGVNNETETLESSGVAVNLWAEGLVEFGKKHTDFAGPSISSSFFR